MSTEFFRVIASLAGQDGYTAAYRTLILALVPATRKSRLFNHRLYGGGLHHDDQKAIHPVGHGGGRRAFPAAEVDGTDRIRGIPAAD
ncbi:MAG: hypothetical protein IDH49_01585 [Gammaproteobacteria bacterium]|nr:hypothetical protein [Gammaproteobacteria bacterium]